MSSFHIKVQYQQVTHYSNNIASSSKAHIGIAAVSMVEAEVPLPVDVEDSTERPFKFKNTSSGKAYLFAVISYQSYSRPLFYQSDWITFNHTHQCKYHTTQYLYTNPACVTTTILNLVATLLPGEVEVEMKEALKSFWLVI